MAQLSRGFNAKLREPDHFFRNRVQLVEREALGDTVNQINDIVKRTGQGVNDIAVEGRDKCLMQKLKVGMGDLVSFFFMFGNEVDVVLLVIKMLQHVGEFG